MNRKLKIATLGLALISSLIGVIKIAEASYNEPYKVTINGKTSIYIPGVPPGQPHPSGISSPSVPKSRAITLNNCGIGRISKGTTSPIINIEGAGINFAGRITGGKPSCTLDKTTGAYNSNWSTTPVGTVLDDGTSFYIKGGTTAGAITVQTTNDAAINTKANECGTIRINVSDTRPMTIFKIGMVNIELSSLPDKLPELCRASVKYLPPQSESVSSGG